MGMVLFIVRFVERVWTLYVLGGEIRWDGVLGGSGGQEVWMCNVRMGTGIELAHVTI